MEEKTTVVFSHSMTYPNDGEQRVKNILVRNKEAAAWTQWTAKYISSYRAGAIYETKRCRSSFLTEVLAGLKTAERDMGRDMERDAKIFRDALILLGEHKYSVDEIVRKLLDRYGLDLYDDEAYSGKHEDKVNFARCVGDALIGYIAGTMPEDGSFEP